MILKKRKILRLKTDSETELLQKPLLLFLICLRFSFYEIRNVVLKG